MLREAMLALRVTDMEYVPEICRYLRAAVKDLNMAGVVIEGTCEFEISEDVDPETGEETITVTDNSTITDEAVQTAMITYARMHFGSPPDYDRLAASYDLQRRQLANATGYTDFLEDEEEEPAEDEAGNDGTGENGTGEPDGGDPAEGETGTEAEP